MTMSTVDLRAEAVAEAARLTQARAVLRDGDAGVIASLEGAAPWILIARRHRIRRAVRGRVCTVWRIALEDPSGRLMESRLIAVFVDARRRPSLPRRAWIRTLLRDSDAIVRASVQAACEEWTTVAADVTRAFSDARMKREHDIRGQAPAAAPPLQHGLFDRRAERSRASALATAAESDHAAAERQRTIAAAAMTAVGPPLLLLVLVP
jgi:hypothetical protein